ncbi:uncharacterized protein LOC130012497 [Patella vulgata]|uniref:uncharacterized protein LOC130012497 n=1 Tax=Patella vulgata TaxID=6465 RepID=UPI0024A7EC94|nr:uncharacterized protein LOC130012497 [Patella vulgata]
MISHQIPSRPWQFVGTDLFEFNEKPYLITVDYFSNYFEVDHLKDKTAKTVIPKMKAHFARHGLPERVISDNGPPYNSADFVRFSNEYEFDHITSSPTYPKSNGKAENAVKTAKQIMRKALEDKADAYLALLDWRNTPSEGLKSSPCQRLFGRRCRTLLPTCTSLLEPKLVTDVKSKLEERKSQQTAYHDRSSKELCLLKTGDIVRVKPVGSDKRWVKAQVENQVDVRSYDIRTDGRTYRRNRRHLRKTSDLPCVEKPNFQHTPTRTVPELACARYPNNLSETGNSNKLPIVSRSPVKSKNSTVKQTEGVSPKPTTRVSGRTVKKPNYLKDYITN